MWGGLPTGSPHKQKQFHREVDQERRSGDVVYKVQEYPKGSGRLEGASARVCPSSAKSFKTRDFAAPIFVRISPKLLAALLGIHPYLFCTRTSCVANQAARDRSQISRSGPKCFGEGAKGLCRHRSKRLVALAQHGVARAQTLFALAQVTFGRLSVPRAQETFYTPERQLSVICAHLTSVHGALVCNPCAKAERKNQ